MKFRTKIMQVNISVFKINTTGFYRAYCNSLSVSGKTPHSAIINLVIELKKFWVDESVNEVKKC